LHNFEIELLKSGIIMIMYLVHCFF